jgi:hypothetical protein
MQTDLQEGTLTKSALLEEEITSTKPAARGKILTAVVFVAAFIVGLIACLF